MISAERIVFVFRNEVADSTAGLSCKVGAILFSFCIFPVIKEKTYC